MGKILKEIKETETESVAEILKNPATEPVSEPETPKVDTELDTKVDTEVEHEPVIKPKKTKQPAPKQSDADKLLELHKQKEQLKKDIKGTISIKAVQKNYPVYYGTSQIEGFQDYALCNNSYSEVSLNTEIYAPVNKSKLTIVKIDADTKEPLKGVKFQVEFIDGTKNTYVTDKNGKITIANLRPGTVKIKEAEAIEQYKLDDEEINIELGYNEEKELTIQNEKIKVPEVEEKVENPKTEEETPIPEIEEKVEVEQKKLPKTGENEPKLIFGVNIALAVVYSISVVMKRFL